MLGVEFNYNTSMTWKKQVNNILRCFEEKVRMPRRILRTILKVLLLIVVLDIAILAFFTFSRPAPEQVDVVIVLGAARKSQAARNRALEAATIVENVSVKSVIFSGGKAEDGELTEAGYMRDVYELKNPNSLGEPRLLVDPASENTFQNIRNSREIFPEAKSAVIVSDRYHLARGTLVALRAGYYPVYWSGPAGEYYSKWDLGRYYLREFFGLIAYLPKFVFNRNIF